MQAKTLGAENYIISEFVCRLGDEIEIDQCMVNSPNKEHLVVSYSCQLSRIMRESRACGSKIVISRIQTNISRPRLTDNSECNCLKTD